jgi:hypothetical protein
VASTSPNGVLYRPGAAALQFLRGHHHWPVLVALFAFALAAGAFGSGPARAAIRC